MSTKSFEEDIVWIIGASSGIGAALALELDKRGSTIVLSARRKEKLTKLAAEMSGMHTVFALDIENSESIDKAAKTIRKKYGRIDRVIFLAAAYQPMNIDKLDINMVEKIININLLGAFRLIHAVLPVIHQQKYSQIALCGSIAGYSGLPKGQPYSSTKSAIINLAETLDAELPKKIDVKLISPGFVKTDLTNKNKFEMPEIISADKAAMYIADGLRKNKFEIAFPWKIVLALKLLRLLPYSMSRILARAINK